MPTPVPTARQCLAPEAAAALDAAVGVARCRSHAQTTSLHVIYALLSSSSSPSSASASASKPALPSLLRDALARARSSAYSPRLQFKALELCFGVALDRLPSASSSSSSSSSSVHQNAAAPRSPASDEPPVSNSLMAAIKRSQANQRRSPDTFHLYQQHSSSSSSTSFSGVRVELQHLVLAILDDPIISRVFGEAGFRSYDIKLAILRPTPPILRFPSSARCPPLFLCSFASGDDFDGRGFAFPSIPPTQLGSDAGEENCRRIGEILMHGATGEGRNPMLVGVGACEAARDFGRAIERQDWVVLPSELRGIRLVPVGAEAPEQIEEAARAAEGGPGVVLSIGDLKGLVEDCCEEKRARLVSEVTRVLELHRGRLWVMGWSATYETYLKFLSRQPLLDKDWELQLLPLTSVRAGTGGSFPKPQSLMESFVPLGGFFPETYQPNRLLNSHHPSALRCHHCDDKYQQEVAAILKGNSVAAEDQDKIKLHWLNKAGIVSTKEGIDVEKVKNDSAGLNFRITDVQKKWNDYCMRLHQSGQRNELDNPQLFPKFIGLSDVSDVERIPNQNSTSVASENLGGNGRPFPETVGSQKIDTVRESSLLLLGSEPRNEDLISKLQFSLSESEQLQGKQSQQGALSNLPNHEDNAPPSSVASVTTDLVLGTPNEPSSKEGSPACRRNTEPAADKPGFLQSEKVDEINMSIPQLLVQSYSCVQSSFVNGTNSVPQILNSRLSGVSTSNHSTSHTFEKFDSSNYKSLCAALFEKVGRQEEALSAISKAIVHCKMGERRRGASLKGDIWFSFHGPDCLGKKRVAVALAELVYGSKENLISIDLSYQDGIIGPPSMYYARKIDEVDTNSRGKTNVDYIAGELNKRPWSILVLENVNKADFLVQNSLSHAIQTGKFPDSHGREFSINNAIIVMTSKSIHGNTSSPRSEGSNFSEERILVTQGLQMKIIVESTNGTMNTCQKGDVLLTLRKSSNTQTSLCSGSICKRKLNTSSDHGMQPESLGTHKRAHRTSNNLLDLNLPVEEVESNVADSSDSIGSCTSENSDAWADSFFDLVDLAVNFRPFDFECLANRILKDISQIVSDIHGSNCMLEIDVKAMEQILAAAWALEDRRHLDMWLEKVLRGSLIELSQRYKLLSSTVLRLVTCGDAVMEHAPGILLPSRIHIN